MKQLSNKRTLADVVYDGTNLTLKGSVEINTTEGNIVGISGQISLADNTVIGDFRLTSINIYQSEYYTYRTEASQLLDELINDIKTGTIEEV